MIGIIGKKVGMTQIFNDEGQQIPCTVVEAPPNPVLQVTDPATAGMAQVQLGYGVQRMRRESGKGERDPKGRRASRAAIGHAAKAGLAAPPLALRSRSGWTMRRARIRRSPRLKVGDDRRCRDLRGG